MLHAGEAGLSCAYVHVVAPVEGRGRVEELVKGHHHAARHEALAAW